MDEYDAMIISDLITKMLLNTGYIDQSAQRGVEQKIKNIICKSFNIKNNRAMIFFKNRNKYLKSNF
jgi:hypothetical protein